MNLYLNDVKIKCKKLKSTNSKWHISSVFPHNINNIVTDILS